MSQPSRRKLAAILSADVVGYSRLMGEDEEHTLATLKQHRETMAQAIRSHRGSIVNAPGDALLAEFTSAVDAVAGAIEIQKNIETSNADLEPNRRMSFRIGINLGDVIEDEGAIYGNGVNVPARVESLGTAGKVTISGNVFEQVRNKLPIGFEFMGRHAVKNISGKISVYQVLTEAEAAGTVSHAEEPAAPIRGWIFGAVAAALAVVLGILLVIHDPWQVLPHEDAEPPDKPSIAVLPFRNVLATDSAGAEPDDDSYFADGITEDLITDLSKVSGLFVVARNSVFPYKGLDPATQDVGRELGVRYVLEGTVRRHGREVRINAALIDAMTGKNVWSDRYDGDLDDIFDFQDNVAQQIVSMLEVKLTRTEQEMMARRPTGSMEAYDSFLQAERSAHGLGAAGPADAPAIYRDAVDHYDRAITLDSLFADARAGVARLDFEVWRRDLDTVRPAAEARERAHESAARALTIDPDNSRAHAVRAVFHMVDRKHDDALAAARKSVELHPGSAEAHLTLATVLAHDGAPEQAIAELRTARRLDPKPAPAFFLTSGLAHFLNRDYEAAIAELRDFETAVTALDQVPDNTALEYLETLAGAYARLGRVAEAEDVVGRLLARVPWANLAYYRVLYGHHRRDEDLDHRIEALAAAGCRPGRTGSRGGRKTASTAARWRMSSSATSGWAAARTVRYFCAGRRRTAGRRTAPPRSTSRARLPSRTTGIARNSRPCSWGESIAATFIAIQKARRTTATPMSTSTFSISSALA